MIANGREVVTGIPMSCVNGQYSTLCNDGTLQQSGFDFLCKAIGFDNGKYNKVSPSSLLFISRCPDSS